MNFRFRPLVRRLPALVCALGVLSHTCTAWAQIPGGEPPAGRGYTIQYILVVVLSGMAMAAVCKSSYRHAKDEE
jgi:hypothetical protein